MAFALPSFNAAVASASTSGAPLQRLQANIDFQDVKSDFATKALTELPYKKFLTEAAIARDALAEYGASLRNKMDLDYNREVNEINREDAKRNALVKMLMGSDANAGLALSPLPDPRVERINQLSFEQGVRNAIRSSQEGLDPDGALGGVLDAVTSVPSRRAGGTATQSSQTNTTVPVVTVDPAKTSSKLFDMMLQKVQLQKQTQK
tara:strand:+ start:1383 stop:2000 length:618 start_codon:yes stop_codon:yes gene_type:complete